MSVCFEYCGNRASRFPHQQGFRLLELRAFESCGADDDASSGAIGLAAAEGIHAGMNVSLTARGVIFLIDSKIEPCGNRANGMAMWWITNKVLLNGEGYNCVTRNSGEFYQPIWVRKCEVFAEALPRSTAPRPHTPMIGTQRNLAAEQVSRRGTIYANAPDGRPRAETEYANLPETRPRANTEYANAPEARPRADTVYANTPPNPALVRRPQAGRHRAGFLSPG
jgi:hypothetical protein